MDAKGYLASQTHWWVAEHLDRVEAIYLLFKALDERLTHPMVKGK